MLTLFDILGWLCICEREKHRAMEVKAESQSPTAAHTSCLPPCLRDTHTHTHTGVSYTSIKAVEVFEIALLVLISSPCISSGSLLSHFYFCLHSNFFSGFPILSAAIFCVFCCLCFCTSFITPRLSLSSHYLLLVHHFKAVVGYVTKAGSSSREEERGSDF